MKKLILLVAVAFISITSASAQTITTALLSSTGAASTTITNTGTDSLVVVLNQGYVNIAFQPKVTRLTGTMTSNSTPTIKGSYDGNRYYTIAAADTLHITNTATPIATNWIVGSQNYKYYKMIWTGAGTMTAKMECLFFGIKN